MQYTHMHSLCLTHYLQFNVGGIQVERRMYVCMYVWMDVRCVCTSCVYNMYVHSMYVCMYVRS
jgi:hypothetical protein